MIQNFQKFAELFEQSKGPGYPTYKPQYGKSAQTPAKNKIKVFSMPPTGGVFGKRVLKHYGLGNEGKGSALCPKTTGNSNSCPVCDWIAAAHESDDPVKVKKADKLRASERYYIFVANIDLLQKENKKYVGVYDAPPTIYRKIVSDMISNDYDFTEWKSPVLEITAYEQGQNKPKKLEIGVSLHKMSAEILELDPKEWLELFPKEEDLVKIPSPKLLSSLLHGKEEEDDEAGAKWDDSEKAEVAESTPPVYLKSQLAKEKSEPEPEQKKADPAKSEPAKSEPAKTDTTKARPTLDDLLNKRK